MKITPVGPPDPTWPTQDETLAAYKAAGLATHILGSDYICATKSQMENWIANKGYSDWYSGLVYGGHCVGDKTSQISEDPMEEIPDSVFEELEASEEPV